MVGKILWLDLSHRTSRTFDTTDYAPHYIGGRGFSARIAWETIPHGVGALDPENLLVVMTGPLTGTTAPFSGRTSVGSLSPQGWPNEWFSRSSIGGHWGPSLKYAGYDGLVIEGKADSPVALWIDDASVSLLDARDLWGRGVFETQKRLMQELGPGIRVLTIGRAGENLSRIATISTETNSVAGQGGYGAVMGSKNLKAIAVRGSGPVYVAKPDLMTERSRAIVHEARTGSRFRRPRLDAQRVRDFGEKWQACTQQCGKLCGGGCRFYSEVHGAATDKTLAGQFHCVSNFFPGLPSTPYDWELGFAAGFEARHLSDDYGLNQWDLLLGIVPWLRSCHAAGLISQFNGQPIDFNEPTFWAHLLRSIASREGMGDALAEGGRRAPAILGFGEEFAEPLYAGWGSAGHWDGRGDRRNRIVYPFWLVSALQWAVDVRDPFSSSHGYPSLTMHWSPFLNDEGLSWDVITSVAERIYGTPEAAHPETGYGAKEIPAVWHGNRSIMKDSVPVNDNDFPMILSLNGPDGLARADGLVGPDFEYHLFVAATGTGTSRDGFELACERVFNLERSIQIRNFGRSREDDETVIPYFERTEEWENPLVGEKKGLDPSKFRELLDRYYQLRGWDVEQGRPTEATLRRLGLEDVARQLVGRELVIAEDRMR